LNDALCGACEIAYETTDSGTLGTLIYTGCELDEDEMRKLEWQ